MPGAAGWLGSKLDQSAAMTGPFLEPRSREHQTEWPTAEEARGRPQLAAYQSGKPDRAALPKLRGGGSRRGESSTDLQKNQGVST
jgi:hypothetical protein